MTIDYTLNLLSAARPARYSTDCRHIWQHLVAVHGLQDPTPEGAPLTEKIRLRPVGRCAYSSPRGVRKIDASEPRLIQALLEPFHIGSILVGECKSTACVETEGSIVETGRTHYRAVHAHLFHAP